MNKRKKTDRLRRMREPWPKDMVRIRRLLYNDSRRKSWNLKERHTFRRTEMTKPNRQTWEMSRMSQVRSLWWMRPFNATWFIKEQKRMEHSYMSDCISGTEIDHCTMWRNKTTLHFYVSTLIQKTGTRHGRSYRPTGISLFSRNPPTLLSGLSTCHCTPDPPYRFLAERLAR